jgi:hypothetical protein
MIFLSRQIVACLGRLPLNKKVHVKSIISLNIKILANVPNFFLYKKNNVSDFFFNGGAYPEYHT